MLEKEIEAKLGLYLDPYLQKDLLAAKAIRQVVVVEDKVQIDLIFAYPQQTNKKIICEIKELVQPSCPGKMIDVHIHFKAEPHTRPGGVGMPNVKNIIAIASGKGGVGKSTVAVNMALALAKEGARVGILDADIYGPSQPAMLGWEGNKPVVQDKTFQPLMRHGLQTMSIGYLVDDTAAMMWRGPMLGKALEQLLNDTKWDDLDYLIVDLPPGTGDIQLTLCQKMPVSGAVIVTTPQDLALLDVRRACEMFKKLNVPILGVVENMSLYHCSKCGHEEAIFGTGGAKKLAEEYQIALLGSIPLDIHIREMTDSGIPPIVQDPESYYSQAFLETARQTAAKQALLTKDYSAKFPKIIIKHDRG